MAYLKAETLEELFILVLPVAIGFFILVVSPLLIITP